MPIRKPKPTSPGLRFLSYPDFAEITKTKPERTLVEGLKKSGGRNSLGPQDRAPSRRRRQAPVPQDRLQAAKDGVPAKVAAIEYDPNRSAYIALLHYVDGDKAYILAPANAAASARRCSPGADADIKVGNALPLVDDAGRHASVHNVELTAGRGGGADGAARPAVGVQLMRQGGRLRHPAPAVRRDASGPRDLPRDRRRDRQRPSIRTSTIGKAGRKRRWLGMRPSVARYGHEPGRPSARRWRGS